MEDHLAWTPLLFSQTSTVVWEVFYLIGTFSDRLSRHYHSHSCYCVDNAHTRIPQYQRWHVSKSARSANSKCSNFTGPGHMVRREAFVDVAPVAFLNLLHFRCQRCRGRCVRARPAQNGRVETVQKSYSSGTSRSRRLGIRTKGMGKWHQLKNSI